MAEHPLFTLEDVSFCYGDKAALDRLSLLVPAGRFYGILGPNGSGKSTLLDLLLGVRTPAGGALSFRGRPLAGYRRRQLARELALVPQDFQINFDFTVREVVIMGRHPHIPRFGVPGTTDLALVDRAMVVMDVTHLADRPVTGLSGGEKQRVVAARALAQDPAVILLDEATSNLDIGHTLAILQQARRLVREEGKTVLAVLHNINLAAAYCDEIIVLKEGRLRAAGPVARTLSAGLIREVFGVECRVAPDEYNQVPQVSFHYGLSAGAACKSPEEFR